MKNPFLLKLYTKHGQSTACGQHVARRLNFAWIFLIWSEHYKIIEKKVHFSFSKHQKWPKWLKWAKLCLNFRFWGPRQNTFTELGLERKSEVMPVIHYTHERCQLFCEKKLRVRKCSKNCINPRRFVLTVDILFWFWRHKVFRGFSVFQSIQSTKTKYYKHQICII
jgi:hypothetical protein